MHAILSLLCPLLITSASVGPECSWRQQEGFREGSTHERKGEPNPRPASMWQSVRAPAHTYYVYMGRKRGLLCVLAASPPLRSVLCHARRSTQRARVPGDLLQSTALRWLHIRTADSQASRIYILRPAPYPGLSPIHGLFLHICN